MTGQEAMTVEHAFKLLRSSFNGVTRWNGYETFVGRHLRAVETLAAERAALVAERDAWKSTAEMTVAPTAFETAEYALKAAVEVEELREELAQAVAERDRYRDALEEIAAEHHTTNKGAVARAALAVSTP